MSPTPERMTSSGKGHLFVTTTGTLPAWGGCVGGLGSVVPPPEPLCSSNQSNLKSQSPPVATALKRTSCLPLVLVMETVFVAKTFQSEPVAASIDTVPIFVEPA